MGTISTTKMSSKGQVVIPEDIREKLGLKAGDQFIVMGDGDVVILKTIAEPSKSEFSRVLARARVAARESGLTKNDVFVAIRKVRRRA